MTRKGWALAALTLLVVAAAAWIHHRETDRLADARAVDQSATAAREHAEEYAGLLLSYDYRSLENDIARARDLVAPAFMDEFSELQDQVLGPATEQGKIITEAEVKRSATVSASVDRVEVLLFLRQATKQPGQKTVVSTTRAVITMIHSAGTWKVSDLQAL